MKQRKLPNVDFKQIISNILNSSTFSKFEILKMMPTQDVKKKIDISNRDVNAFPKSCPIVWYP